MAIQLPYDLEQRLLKLAERENRSPAAILYDLLNKYDAEPEVEAETAYVNPRLGMLEDAEAANLEFADNEVTASTHLSTANPLLMLAQTADKMGWKSGRSDISENVGQILSDILADDYRKRQANEDGE